MATQTLTYTTDATLLEIRTKIPAFMKMASDLTMQNRVMLPLMRKWGTITTGRDISWSQEWNAKVQLPQVRTWSDDVLPMWQPGPVPIKFNLSDGSYEADDKMTKMQMMRLQGARTKIIDYYTEKSKDLVKSMGHNFNFQFLHGTGTGRNITGLDAVLTTSGGTNVAADKVALMGAAVTYAGQTLRPGTIGTNWPDTLSVSPNANLSTDWPIIGNQTTYDPTLTAYDCTSPLMLNSTSTSWDSGATWLLNCEEVLRYFVGVQRQRGGSVADASSPIVALCGEQRLRQARTTLSAKNYALLPVTEAMQWGMPETVNFEGCWLTTDSDVGSDVAYMIQPDMLEYSTPSSDLWETFGPEWSLPVVAYLYLLLAIGTFRLQPKYCGKISDVA